jgi:hypothetical protein
MECAFLNKLTKLTTLLLLFTFFTFNVTVWAETAPASKTLNISLTIGKKDIMINDTSLTGEAPYITKDGSTLVPLRVITTAFGAVLAYDASTKTIGLKYNGHDLSLTIDNKMATVDGKTVEMNTAPQLHNGTTMVPVRFITENFGAAIKFDKVTKQITITGDALVVDTSGELNSDIGKTKIGDSYNNWTMKYPTGLVKTDQSFMGSIVTFTDANSEFTLNLNIANTDVQDMSSEALLKDLSDYISNTVLNKTTVTENGITYAKIVSKDKTGLYNEARSYYSKGKIYYLSLTVEKEANFVNPIKYASYKELLDSFTVSYDNKDFTIKDLSTAKDGYRKYTSDDYGFSLNIPADWYKDDETGSHFYFYSDTATNQGVNIGVSSLKDGESLESWVTKENQDFTDTFVAAFGNLASSQTVKVGGVDAVDNFYDQSIGGKWTTDESIYLVSGKLKYNIDFMYPKDAPAEEIKAKREAFISSFTLTNKMNPALGFISDGKVDKQKKAKIINKDYKLSFELPEYWTEDTKTEQEDGSLDYDFTGGTMSIYKYEVSKDTASSNLETYVRGNSEYKITSITDTTVAGQSAKKMVYSRTSENMTTTVVIYIIGEGAKSFAFIYGISDSFATSAAMQRFEEVVTSIQITP